MDKGIEELTRLGELQNETKALKKLVTRQLGLTRRQPDPPSEVRLSANGDRLTWHPPKNKVGLSSFRIWVDTDGGPPAFELLPGQCSLMVPNGSQFFIASHNGPMDLTSRKVRVSARSTAAGLEYAPNVTGIAGAIERRDTDGGIQQWRYSLTWAEPTTDLRYRLVAAYVIYVDDGGANRTRVVELPKGSTAYVSEWANVPSPAETYKIRVVSKATLGGENPIVEGVTPTYEVTVSYTAGGSGVEYTGNVTITGAATVQYPGKADGTYQAIISIPFSAPANDPTWGSVDMVAYDGVTYLTLTKADSVSPCDAVVTPPATVESWSVYLVSRDTAGRRNSITASTPKATIAIGSASGQLNGAKIVAGSVSTVHLDAEGISVGGGGGKPGVLTVHNASGTQIGFVGMDGKRTGVVNTSGTAVTRTSGDVFVAAMAGLPISINSVIYTVASVGGASNLTLTGSAGTQAGVGYVGWVGEGGWFKTVSVGGTSYGTGKLKADASGNVVISGASITVTDGDGQVVNLNPTDGLKTTYLTNTGRIRQGELTFNYLSSGNLAFASTVSQAAMILRQYTHSGGADVLTTEIYSQSIGGGLNSSEIHMASSFNPGVSAPEVRHNIAVGPNAAGCYANFYSVKVDGATVIDHSRNIIGGSAWNGNHLILGTYHLWIDSTGDLRIKNSAPTNDTDGTVVGSQS